MSSQVPNMSETKFNMASMKQVISIIYNNKFNNANFYIKNIVLYNIY